jgi:signal transduction histidine kinase
LDSKLCPEEQKAQYLEVLERQSKRLKKLTEDLVEASKASTGVLNINREKISLNQLLDQALGEWSDKLGVRSLSVITGLPEGEVCVYADGRHLWRVLDNLLANCAKYALEGTRIYIDLARGKGQVVLSVKNISREPLNIPPEQLMERFVRGDSSRSTEGSGLGLSIAKELLKRMGEDIRVTSEKGRGTQFSFTVHRYETKEN